MPRRVYFAFDYQDVIDFRANVVRNSHRFRGQTNRFKDASIWEEAKRKNPYILKSMIDGSISRASVTCVLIGSETYNRRWVRYEIAKSFADGKGLLGVHINWIKGKTGDIKIFPGANPFDCIKVYVNKGGTSIHFLEKTNSVFNPWKPLNDLRRAPNYYLDEEYFDNEILLSELFDNYSYKLDNGAAHLEKWIEQAAYDAGK